MSSNTIPSGLLRACETVCNLLIPYLFPLMTHILCLDCELLLTSLPSDLMIVGFVGRESVYLSHHTPPMLEQCLDEPKELFIHCCVHCKYHIYKVNLYYKGVGNVDCIGFHRKMTERIYISQNAASDLIKLSIGCFCSCSLFLFQHQLILSFQFILSKALFPIFSIISAFQLCPQIACPMSKIKALRLTELTFPRRPMNNRLDGANMTETFSPCPKQFIRLFIYIFLLVCKGQAQGKVGMGGVTLLKKIFPPFSYK